MSTIIQFRRGTAAEWTAANTILANGEKGLETDGLGTAEVKEKIGNGVLAWNDLPYQESGGGGAVDSVNGETGVVVLDTSDIAETTDKNYVTDAEKGVIGDTSGTNTGDETTGTIQAKRPIKTVNSQSLEGVGNIEIDNEKTISEQAEERKQHILSEIQNYKSRLLDVNITKSEYEELTEYQNRNYIVDDGSIYDVDTKTQDCNYVFTNGVDCLVSTSGNNGTGVIGNENFPFASWEFAIDAIPIGGGVTIWIEGGSYDMNTTGVGYAILNRNFTNPVIVKSKPNETVILSHTLQVYAIRFLSLSNNVVFEDLTFNPGSGNIATLYAAGAIEVTNFEARDCVFNNNGSALNYAAQFGSQTSNINNKVKRSLMNSGDGLNGVYVDKATGFTLIGNKSNISVYPDRFLRVLTGCQGVFNLNNNSIISTSTITGTHSVFQMTDVLIGNSTVNFNNNDIVTKSEVLSLAGKLTGRGVTFNVKGNTATTEAQQAIYGLKSVDGGEVSYNTITTDNVCLGLPSESGLVSGSEFGGLEIHYNNLTSTNHTLLYGENGLNNNTHDNILEARNGFYSIVCKGNGHLHSSNLLYGGSQTGLLLKNAQNCISSNDIIIQEIALGSAVRFDEGLAFGSKNNSVTNDKIKVTDGNLIKGIDAANLGDGNFVDSNHYEVTDSGTYGDIYGVINSLQELRRAWRVNVSGSQNNDLNSIDV
jgi:hypothetical protein